jgi:bifunctional UDP-N-acetylglucosamine pyrophosphorylase/glucosamine-1-phosphate N-acetyltransferase
MKLKIIPSDKTESLHPVTCTRKILDCPLGTSTLGAELVKRLSKVLKSAGDGYTFCISEDFWPSADLAASLCEIRKDTVVYFGENKKVVAWISADGDVPHKAEWMPSDSKSLVIKAPWHLLSVNEDIVGSLKKSVINGEIRKGVTIEGNVIVGKGTVILPGVYIDGNVVFGEDCKIGPNCYFRGNTFIGNKCHVGQAVEIKNSILMEKVSAGHLSYIGDSIIGAFSNLGAGTITANFRHDGKNHRSMLNGELIDTGRRKLGVIVGDNVHTGIHTSIYPGRKIWPEMSTRPGDIVIKDLMP